MQGQLQNNPNIIRAKEDIIEMARRILGAFAKAVQNEPGSHISQQAINQNLLMRIQDRLVKDTHIDENSADDVVWEHTEGKIPPSHVWQKNSLGTVQRAEGREIYIQKVLAATDRLKKEFPGNARYGETLDYLKKGLAAGRDAAITLRGMNDTIRLYEIPYVVETCAVPAPATP